MSPLPGQVHWKPFSRLPLCPSGCIKCTIYICTICGRLYICTRVYGNTWTCALFFLWPSTHAPAFSQRTTKSHSQPQLQIQIQRKKRKKTKKKKELGEPTRYRYRHFIDLSAVEASTLHPIRGPLFIWWLHKVMKSCGLPAFLANGKRVATSAPAGIYLPSPSHPPNDITHPRS